MGYAATHGRKCAIVIPYTLTTATLTDFPVCFTQANLPVAANEMFDDGGTYPAKSDGSDIRFSSDEAGDTPMNVEVERFAIAADPANGYAEIWVRIPSFSHTVDTTVYCWWNDPDATAVAVDDADEGSQGVWDANYKGVYHLSEASGNIQDSTANANHSTSSGGTPGYGSAGAWAGSSGIDLDGAASEYFSGPAPATVAPMTVSAWVKPENVTAFEGIASISDTALTATQWALILDGNATFASDSIAWAVRNTGGFSAATKTTYAAGNWYHFAGKEISSASRYAYLNGVAGTQNTGNLSPTSIDTLDVGRLGDSSPSSYLNGVVDELRVSDDDRADEWLLAEYTVINSIASITPGTPESPGASIGSPIINGAIFSSLIIHGAVVR